MILRNGISGIDSNDSYIKQEQDENACNIKNFSRISYSIENKGTFKITSFDNDLVGKNFYYLEAEMLGKRIFVLLNAIYPYIAFASNLQYIQIDFINIYDLATQYEGFYRVLSVQDLEEVISECDLNQLNSAELNQINYYSPEKIKDIVFNFWD